MRELCFICTVVLGILLAGWTSGAETEPRHGGYEATWKSLNEHEIPEWLLDAKLGIYAHWGVYSVPAFRTEWYGRLMYDTETRGDAVFKHHVERYGPQSKFGYKDFVPMFTAEKFDPDDWAAVITSSGAKYGGITVVHHDGFCLWDTKFSRWNSKQMGPKRDVYGELVAALRKKDKNFKVLTCFHHFRTYGWFHPRNKEMLAAGRKAKWDIFDPKYADFYRNTETTPHEEFLAEWKNKVIEVIDNYRPDVIWFDGGSFRGSKSEPATLAVLTHFYNTETKKQSPVEVINKKSNFHPEFGLRNFEKGGNRPPKVSFPWVDDLNVARRGWCYTDDITYRSTNEIIDGLVDRVSRGGGLMLSLSPKADGTIPDEQKRICREIGDWLKINGQGIYGTRRWKIETEGDDAKLLSDIRKKKMWSFDDTCDASDIRFTRKGDTLYAFFLGWPEDGKLLVKSLGTKTKIADGGVARVTLLGHPGERKWNRNEAGMTVTLPEKPLPKKPPCDFAWGLKIEVRGTLAD